MKVKIFADPEDNKILEFNLYRKSNKVLFIIYADLECLMEKLDEWKNNPENSSATKVGEHILSGFSMPTISLIKGIGNKHDVYRGYDCMKSFENRLKDTQ